MVISSFSLAGLARRLTTHGSRRGLLRALAGGLLTAFPADAAPAKRVTKPAATRNRTCKRGKKRCRGRCVNVKTDERNCGRCGKACDFGADCQNGTCRFRPGFPFVLEWGESGTQENQFQSIQGIAFNPRNDRVYVADGTNDRLTSHTSAGQYVGAFGSTGTGATGLRYPSGIAVSPNGARLYVADFGNGRIKLLSAGFQVEGHWAAPIDGGEPLDAPIGIAVSPNGDRIYITEYYRGRVKVLRQDGSFVRYIGSNGTGPAQFAYPTGIAVSPKGDRLYVADSENDRLKVLTSTGALIGHWGDGSGDLQFQLPWGVAVDAAGVVYVTEAGISRLTAFTPGGKLLGVFGTPGSGNPFVLGVSRAVATAPGGVVYAGDQSTDRVVKLRF